MAALLFFPSLTLSAIKHEGKEKRMKCAVVYYSFSGNTKKVAVILSEYLKQKGEVSLTELKALD